MIERIQHIRFSNKLLILYLNIYRKVDEIEKKKLKREKRKRGRPPGKTNNENKILKESSYKRLVFFF